MNRLFTLITENIFIVMGFAIYGVLVYYMIAKVLHRYTGRKSQRHAAKSAANASNPASDKSGFSFNKKTANADNDASSRKDFAKNIPTANSYIHKKSQQG